LFIMSTALAAVVLAPAAHAGDIVSTPVDISLVSAVTPSSAAPGATVTFTLSVGNNGEGSANNVRIDAAFPATLDTLTVATSAVYACGFSGTNLVCNLATHPEGVTATIEVTARVVPAAVSDGQVIQLSATASMLATPDPNPSNNSASSSFTVAVPATTTSTTLAPTTTAATTTTAVAGGAQPTTTVASIPETGSSATGDWALWASVLIAIGCGGVVIARRPTR
jgi:uncharacterized repeat protein (TIGR01451 family)